MLLKQHFQDTVARLGLDDLESEQERAIAEIVWHRCEAAMMQQSPQTAALLKKRYVHSSFDAQLTRQEVQFLNQVFASMLTISSYNIRELKGAIQEYWLQCDPDNSETQEHFEHLNQLRSLQRKFKKSHNQLATIQRKLKKSR